MQKRHQKQGAKTTTKVAAKLLQKRYQKQGKKQLQKHGCHRK